MATATFPRKKTTLPDDPQPPLGLSEPAQQGHGSVAIRAERRPIPTPFVTQAELEGVAALSTNALNALLDRLGWREFGSSLFLGRARGSPRIFPLILLPAVHLARFEAEAEATSLMDSCRVSLEERWPNFVALLRLRIPRYPPLGWAIAQGDVPATAREMAAGPDLLRAAEELALKQLDVLADTETVRVGIWRKVDLDDERVVDAYPLPDELQSPTTGKVGVVLAIAGAAALRLFYRVGMPARPMPLEPGTTLRDGDTADVPGIPEGVRSQRSMRTGKRR